MLVILAGLTSFGLNGYSAAAIRGQLGTTVGSDPHLLAGSPLALTDITACESGSDGLTAALPGTSRACGGGGSNVAMPVIHRLAHRCEIFWTESRVQPYSRSRVTVGRERIFRVPAVTRFT